MSAQDNKSSYPPTVCASRPPFVMIILFFGGEPRLNAVVLNTALYLSVMTLLLSMGSPRAVLLSKYVSSQSLCCLVFGILTVVETQ